MTKSVENLKFLANMFEPRDWNYTRSTNIKDITSKVPAEYEKLIPRIRRALGALYSSKGIFGVKDFDWSVRSRISYFLFSLKRTPNTPDGILNNGSVITFWEEDGEYIQMMQPSVGVLLAEFLEAEPENPYAELITKELNRIQRGYKKRIKNGNVR